MYIAKCENGNRISIDKAERKKKYKCPICKSDVIAKKGDINKHHFCHKNNKDCDTWHEMSEWHKNWQERFDDEYREITIGNHRADILKDGWIIEFQKSNLSTEEMKERIDFYTKENKLIFIINLIDKDIWDTCKKSYFDTKFYLWNHYSRSIIEPEYNEDYYLFFQIQEDKLIWVKSKGLNYKKDEISWKCIEVYKELTKNQFINYFSNIDKYEDVLIKKRRKKERYLIEKEFKEEYERYRACEVSMISEKFIKENQDEIIREAKVVADRVLNKEQAKRIELERILSNEIKNMIATQDMIIDKRKQVEKLKCELDAMISMEKQIEFELKKYR